MAIRGILFDKDGTLLDFEATWGPLYRRLALDLAGGDETRAQAMLVTGGLDPQAGRMRAGSVLGAGTTHEIVALWFPELRDEAFHAMATRIDAAFHAHGATSSIAVKDLVETLAALADKGYSMGVATNDATQAAIMAVRSVGAEKYLPHIFGYDSVPKTKPAPDLVHAFAAAVGLAAAEIAVVGDNLHDLDMAKAAGAGLAVGVLTGNSSRADLAPHADVVLDSVRDLPAYLASIA